jgi:hypothetical protein
MLSLVEWFQAVPGHRFVPLFATDASLVVQTKLSGPQERRLLCRSAKMEQAVIEMVEEGLNNPSWQGLLYVMGWGEGTTFRPLYVGKAERAGVKHPLSVNLANIRTNRHMFARWGDGLAYHIGDLSQALFGWDAYLQPSKKYKRWVSVLFVSAEPPRLREVVTLYLAPWVGGCKGPSGLAGSLPAVEKEVIALGSVQFADCLLNVDGV